MSYWLVKIFFLLFFLNLKELTIRGPLIYNFCHSQFSLSQTTRCSIFFKIPLSISFCFFFFFFFFFNSIKNMLKHTRTYGAFANRDKEAISNRNLKENGHSKAFIPKPCWEALQRQQMILPMGRVLLLLIHLMFGFSLK